jgi:hypothetical protein
MMMHQGGYTLASRNSYCEGIVSGIQNYVKKCKLEEERKRAEKLARARQKHQRQSTGASCDDDNDGDDDGNDDEGECNSDSDGGGSGSRQSSDKCENSSGNKRKHSVMTGAATLLKLENEEKVSCALILHTEDVAAKILKAKNIKVKSVKRVGRIEVNRNAWSKGVADSKNINLNERAIKE